MSKKRIALISSLVILMLLVFSIIFISLHIKSQMQDLFKMNKELQEENYYMAEFEFKLLGLSYLLDHGKYYTAISKLNQLHNQLETREGLVKVPDFNNTREEFEFYLNLQNPKTGAFMDDSYPLNTYHEPTENVLLHLDSLAEELGEPLELKYPLVYLDNINTTEKLIPILEDWSTVGWIGSKFPQTSFHNVRDLLVLARDYEHHNDEEFDMVIEKNGFYNFSKEWKYSMLKWFYDYQDPKTGTWSPKSKNGEILKKDLSNTAPILKTFVDSEGNDIYEEFPLRYKDELFSTILEELDKELPKEDKLDEWHEWGLETPKGLRTLTRYLWKNVSNDNKERARILIKDYIKIKFEKFYILKEGAFSYYPNSEHATMDGTSSGIAILKEFGAFSYEKQIRIWGSPENNINDLGIIKVSSLKEEDFNFGNESNSFRVYLTEPNYENLNINISEIFYLTDPIVLDAIELVINLNKWFKITDQTLGNWVSKEELQRELNNFNIEETSIYYEIPIDILNKQLKENQKIIIIAFDVAQVPRYKIIFEKRIN